MSERHAPPPPTPPPLPLRKQSSWSPDVLREEAWLRRKDKRCTTARGSTVTEEDFEELKACFDLGFGFDSSSNDVVDSRLSDAFPALDFFDAVNKKHNKALSRSSSSLSCSSSTSSFVCESELEITGSIIDPGEDPAKVKSKLKQWAQVVASSVKMSPSF